MYHMRNLPRLITDSEPLTPILREGLPVFVDGKPVKRNPFRFFARGLVVPVDGNQLLLVPEGDRQKEQYWIFQQQWRSLDETGANVIDQRIELEDKALLYGHTFVCLVSKVWGSYIQARLMRVDTGADTLAFPTLPKEIQ